MHLSDQTITQLTSIIHHNVMCIITCGQPARTQQRYEEKMHHAVGVSEVQDGIMTDLILLADCHESGAKDGVAASFFVF
jgi:hypothetical protein